MYLMQTWWEDGWSYGTRYTRQSVALQAAEELSRIGWTTRVVDSKSGTVIKSFQPEE